MKNNKGVTLIELIMIIALIGIVITPIFSFLISNVKAYNREDTEIELSFEAEKITSYITKHIVEENDNFKNDYNLIDNELKYKGSTIGKYVEYYKFETLSNDKSLKFYIKLKKDNIIKESTVKINLRNTN